MRASDSKLSLANYLSLASPLSVHGIRIFPTCRRYEAFQVRVEPFEIQLGKNREENASRRRRRSAILEFLVIATLR